MILHDNSRTMSLFAVHAVSFSFPFAKILFVWLKSVVKNSACDCVCAQKMSNKDMSACTPNVSSRHTNRVYRLSRTFLKV